MYDDMTPEECANIVRRERTFLGFGPKVAAMSDVDVLVKGTSRTGRVMRHQMKHGAAFVANGALVQHTRTQMAFNYLVGAESSE